MGCGGSGLELRSGILCVKPLMLLVWLPGRRFVTLMLADSLANCDISQVCLLQVFLTVHCIACLIRACCRMLSLQPLLLFLLCSVSVGPPKFLTAAEVQEILRCVWAANADIMQLIYPADVAQRKRRQGASEAQAAAAGKAAAQVLDGDDWV